MSRAFGSDSGLVLIGYRGTGKSTTGALLARRLGLPFADLDRSIEAAAGCSISSLFSTQGEPAFREWEERVIAEEAVGSQKVLATGGGAILRESNRIALRRFGLVIWLSAAPDVIAERLRRGAGAVAERPALTTLGTLEEIAEVLSARIPLYESVADVEVSTEGRSPAEVVEAILSLLPDVLSADRKG
jgi:shikimate kinase